MKFQCEFTDCTAPATSQWVGVDEDNDPYCTYRCEAHPETELDYEELPLPQPTSSQLDPVFLEALRPFAPSLFGSDKEVR